MAAGCQPDCRMCTTLIEVCTRKGHSDRALQMYELMRDAPAGSKLAPSVHAFTAAMRAAAEGGYWERALDIWQDMEKAGCRATGEIVSKWECRLRAVVLGPIVQGSILSEFACWYSLTLLFCSILPGRNLKHFPVVAQHHVCTGHAYAAAISACAVGGAWQHAVRLFDEMLDWQIKPDVVSCTALNHRTGRRWSVDPC